MISYLPYAHLVSLSPFSNVDVASFNFAFFFIILSRSLRPSCVIKTHCSGPLEAGVLLAPRYQLT